MSEDAVLSAELLQLIRDEAVQLAIQRPARLDYLEAALIRVAMATLGSSLSANAVAGLVEGSRTLKRDKGIS